MIKIKEHPVLNSYCLYVFHRFKEIDNLGHVTSKYKKRTIEQVQSMENVRSRLHKESLRILLSEYGYTKKQATNFLESEIEKLIKGKYKKLKDNECHCGLCSINLKTKDFDKHSKTQVHQYIGREVIKLHTLSTQIKLDIMKNE